LIRWPRRNGKFIWLVGLLLAYSIGASAQQAPTSPMPISISGIVQTDGRIAIPGATVRIERVLTGTENPRAIAAATEKASGRHSCQCQSRCD
jgi:hypothetical protein